eukprot:TRINITY_DN2941_c0_g1_i11.p1 TRINITY_DN2941_c0_g1~~TRINITY_DN2941_c0_g1_i11.p1  ORF type:complete len:162 (-),score=30.14 TRINITY_DN2941_c0_g1_i11:268-753(-)
MQTVASHLNDPDGWTAFNEFLKKEFCSEGTEFWKSVSMNSWFFSYFQVQTLRLLTGPKDIQTQIETIYETFILDSAPTQLNISGSVFDQLIAIYGNPKKYSIKIFDEAEKEVLALMKDAFFRYANSQHYQIWVEAKLKNPDSLRAYEKSESDWGSLSVSLI